MKKKDAFIDKFYQLNYKQRMLCAVGKKLDNS